MASEYSRPMLDVGNPRIFNCNALSHKILTQDAAAPLFFSIKQLNHLVLIKEALRDDSRPGSPIGTKLYFPFNENDVYEGGRTIFAHDKQLEPALVEMYGRKALPPETLSADLKLIKLLDRLPSLDPFLLKEAFLNEGLQINLGYFEIGGEIWREIEEFILERFEPVAKAAFPDTISSDDKAKQLIEKIWEARDLQALDPLIRAFRLPQEEALGILSAWKGINFYSFQYQRAKPLFVQLLTWLRDLQLPPTLSIVDRNKVKATLEQIKTELRNEWQKVEAILQNYESSYDKMFKTKTSSTDFVTFLKNSNKAYWLLGNSLGKIGQASYCWNQLSKRFPERKLPWEQMNEVIILLDKIFQPEKKTTTSVAWT